MSGNSQLKTPQISAWLTAAAKQLREAGIPSARLDAEIILSHTLRKNRAWLHAHGDEPIDPTRLDIADARLQLRYERTPVAYIIGHREFYGRLFKVTPATLIPRPESETIIELLKEYQPKNRSLFSETHRLVDVGTGSGCLGITAKLEFPELEVTLCDISRHALTVAGTNAKLHKADVTVLEGDLLAGYPFTASIIIANLPYVDPAWERSPETSYEPELALFATDHGLQIIKRLLTQATQHLVARGLLLLEADPRQHETLIAEARRQGFSLQTTRDFIVALTYTPPALH